MDAMRKGKMCDKHAWYEVTSRDGVINLQQV